MKIVIKKMKFKHSRMVLPTMKIEENLWTIENLQNNYNCSLRL